MRIAGLRLINWCRYKGVHELALGPGAYAVLAKHEADADRSNWLGKSALLSAVWFALTGEKPDSARYEDDWLSRSKDGSWGAAEGGVELELDDGTFISRLRTRGQSTQLTVERPSLEKPAAQDIAQGVIDGLVGFSLKDSRVTWYAEQREVSRLVRMEPTPRTEVFMQWTGLARVDDAVEGVVGDLGLAARELEEVDAQLAALRGPAEFDEAAVRAELADVLVKLQDDAAALGAYHAARDAWQARQDLVRLDAEVAELVDQLVDEGKLAADVVAVEQLLGQDVAALASYREDVIAWQARQELRRKVARHAELAEQLKQFGDSTGAAARAESAAGSAQSSHELAQLRAGEADREAVAKKRLAVGQFDGVCPVGGIQCPAREQLNADRQTNARLLKGATTAQDAARAAETLARGERDLAREAARQAVATDQRRAVLAEEVAKLAPAVAKLAPAVAEPMPPKSRAAELGAERQRLEGELERSRRARAKAGELNAGRSALVAKAGAAKVAPEQPQLRQAELGAERQRLEGELRARAESAQKVAGLECRREAALRRREVGSTSVVLLETAQRRIAEVSVGAIEAEANGILQRSAIPLGVGVSWERETKEAATHCRWCGSLFPRSRRVKKCEACGSDRGMKVERKVDIRLSDVSGGAEDLAGFALQMAAFAYLKRARAAGWGVLMVDEPFSAVDRSNGASVARYLDGMLRSLDGVEQALVVSHEQRLLDALPGRIAVTGDDEWSRVEVVS